MSNSGIPRAVPFDIDCDFRLQRKGGGGGNAALERRGRRFGCCPSFSLGENVHLATLSDDTRSAHNIAVKGLARGGGSRRCGSSCLVTLCSNVDRGHKKPMQKQSRRRSRRFGFHPRVMLCANADGADRNCAIVGEHHHNDRGKEEDTDRCATAAAFNVDDRNARYPGMEAVNGGGDGEHGGNGRDYLDARQVAQGTSRHSARTGLHPHTTTHCSLCGAAHWMTNLCARQFTIGVRTMTCKQGGTGRVGDGNGVHDLRSDQRAYTKQLHQPSRSTSVATHAGNPDGQRPEVGHTALIGTCDGDIATGGGRDGELDTGHGQTPHISTSIAPHCLASSSLPTPHTRLHRPGCARDHIALPASTPTHDISHIHLRGDSKGTSGIASGIAGAGSRSATPRARRSQLPSAARASQEAQRHLLGGGPAAAHRRCSRAACRQLHARERRRRVPVARQLPRGRPTEHAPEAGDCFSVCCEAERRLRLCAVAFIEPRGRPSPTRLGRAQLRRRGVPPTRIIGLVGRSQPRRRYGRIEAGAIGYVGLLRDAPRSGPKPILRVGEASNPGPTFASWRQLDGAQYRNPDCRGFWEARAPGHSPTQEGQGDVARFALQVVTANTTSWTALKRLLTSTDADVILSQEHRLPPYRLADFSDWARRHGWHSIMLPATQTEAGGWSAGVAIFAKPHAALSAPRIGSECVVPSRVVAATIEPPGHRPCLIMSVYLRDGIGLGTENLGYLADIGTVVRMHGVAHPFIIGGDFQTDPSRLATAGFGEEVGATLMASGASRGTCRTAATTSEIDFFYVQNSLALGVRSVDTVEHAGTRPHVPVALRFHSRVTSARALFLRLPQPLATDRIVGPLQAPPDWDTVRKDAQALAAAARHCALDDQFNREYHRVYAAWADLAEVELARATGHQGPLKPGLRGRSPKLVWRSIVPERVKDPASDKVAAWRTLATAATDIVRCTAFGFEFDDDSVDDEADDDHPRHDPSRNARTCSGGGRPRQFWIDRCRQLSDCILVLDEAQPTDADARDAADRLIDIATAAIKVLESLGADEHNPSVGKACSWQPVRDPIALEIAERARTMRDEITRGMDAAAEADRAAAHLRWKEWLLKNIEAGARNAHKYLKVPEAWRPTTTLTVDGVVTADPLQLLDSYRRKYVGLWNGRDADVDATCRHDDGGDTGDDIRRPWRHAPRGSLSRLLPEDLREAAKSFRVDTMSTYDGFALRHYALLSDMALDCLSELLTVLELSSLLPPQARLATMPLIGKSKGGHRTVASLTSIYRLWARARKSVVKQWEYANDRPFVAAGSGRSPQDAVWRQAAMSEAAVQKGRFAGTILWDMASFYEMVRRLPLWHRARRLNFPIVILRVAISTYEGPRMLSLAGALSRAVCAEHGVMAGCAFANSLTRAYSMEPCDRVARCISEMPSDRSNLDLFVDDIALTVTGSYRQVAEGLIEAKNILQHEVEQSLYCTIEPSKAAVVTSNAKLKKEVATKFGVLAGPIAERYRRRAAPNLGIDYAAGRRRAALASGGKRRRRTGNLQKKALRLGRIRSLLGKRAPMVFAAGPMAEYEYGASVHGLTDSETLLLQRAAAMALSPRARGRSLARVLLLARMPTWRAEVAVILHYAKQVWEAVVRKPDELNGALNLVELARVWRGAQVEGLVDPTSGKRRWALTKGPISSMLLSLNRIGWAMDEPFVMRDRRGEEIVLTRVSPALLAHLLHDAVIEAAEVREGAKIAVHDPSFAGRRLAVEHVVDQLRTDRKLSCADKAAYRSVACGAVMTLSRAVSLGYLVADVCPLCGAKGDTIRHRIWRCQHPTAIAARNAVAPSWIQEEQERRPESDSFWTTGWLPHPADIWPAPASSPDAHIIFGESAEGEEPANEMDRRGLRGTVYGDGSCTTHVFKALRRAATAVVQKPIGSSVITRVRCPVASPLPQSPQAAEYMVAALVQQLANKGCDIDLAVDCLNVARDMNAPFAVAASAKRVQAGINRTTLADTNWAKHVSVRKVKAHVDPATVEEGPLREDARGNQWADNEAKAALAMHPQPSPVMMADLDAALRRAKIVVRTIARVTQVFPPLPRERMVKPPRRVEGASFSAGSGHSWTFNSGLWRCTRCLRLTIKEHLTPALATQPCPGLKPSVQISAMAEKGHIMARTIAEVPILFCLRCGSFSARRAYGLAAACKGRPTAPGAQALARIKRGVQPWQAPGSRTRPPAHSLTEAWSADANRFRQQGPAQRRAGRRRVEEHPVEAIGVDEPTPSLIPPSSSSHQADITYGDGSESNAHQDKRARVDDRDAFAEPPTEADLDAIHDGGGAHQEAPVTVAVAPRADTDAPRRGEAADVDDYDYDPFMHGGALDQRDDPSAARRPEGYSASADVMGPFSRSPVRAVGPNRHLPRSTKRRDDDSGSSSAVGAKRHRSNAAKIEPGGTRHQWRGWDPAQPIWLDPPSWLYLPHLFEPGVIAPQSSAASSEPARQLPRDEAHLPAAKRRRQLTEATVRADAYILEAAFARHGARVSDRLEREPEGASRRRPSADQRIAELRRRVSSRAHFSSNESAQIDLRTTTVRQLELEPRQVDTIRVMADPALRSGANAREGPGDPSASGEAATAVGPSAARAAVAVAKVDVAAILQSSRHAQAAGAVCGEAAYGPPGGAAAPPEDSAMVEVKPLGHDATSPQATSHSAGGEGPHDGREHHFPQNTPEIRLGAGPSEWPNDCNDYGQPPTQGEQRGGGSALAPPPQGARQRAAAAPQPDPAERSGPKGVATSTTAPLVTSSRPPSSVPHPRPSHGQGDLRGGQSARHRLVPRAERPGSERHTSPQPSSLVGHQPCGGSGDHGGTTSPSRQRPLEERIGNQRAITMRQARRLLLEQLSSRPAATATGSHGSSEGATDSDAATPPINNAPGISGMNGATPSGRQTATPVDTGVAPRRPSRAVLGPVPCAATAAAAAVRSCAGSDEAPPAPRGIKRHPPRDGIDVAHEQRPTARHRCDIPIRNHFQEAERNPSSRDDLLRHLRGLHHQAQSHDRPDPPPAVHGPHRRGHRDERLESRGVARRAVPTVDALADVGESDGLDRHQLGPSHRAAAQGRSVGSAPGPRVFDPLLEDDSFGFRFQLGVMRGARSTGDPLAPAPPLRRRGARRQLLDGAAERPGEHVGHPCGDRGHRESPRGHGTADIVAAEPEGGGGAATCSSSATATPHCSMDSALTVISAIQSREIASSHLHVHGIRGHHQSPGDSGGAAEAVAVNRPADHHRGGQRAPATAARPIRGPQAGLGALGAAGAAPRYTSVAATAAQASPPPPPTSNEDAKMHSADGGSSSSRGAASVGHASLGENLGEQVEGARGQLEADAQANAAAAWAWHDRGHRAGASQV